MVKIRDGWTKTDDGQEFMPSLLSHVSFRHHRHLRIRLTQENQISLCPSEIIIIIIIRGSRRGGNSVVGKSWIEEPCLELRDPCLIRRTEGVLENVGGVMETRPWEVQTSSQDFLR